ncbi:MAG TPA: thiamine phosphate synthase, partial [Opitutaceae bacterium]
AAGCLDYVGVGPWRFTANKKNLAPLLGHSGVQQLIVALGDLPAWIIGGIELADLPATRSIGAAGVAVSSALYRGGQIESNVKAFLHGWPFPVQGALKPLGSASSSAAVQLNRPGGSR